MTLTTHLIIGAAIGSKISNPLIALIAGILSHFLLDALPHKEYPVADWDQAAQSLSKKDFKNSGVKFYRIILDGILGISLVALFLIAKNNDFSMIIGTSGGLLPDILWGLYFLFPNKILKKYAWFHEFCHISERTIPNINKKIPAPGKIIIETTVIILSIIFLIR